MDPMERWDDWEWENAAREIGRGHKYNNSFDKESGQNKRYHFADDSVKRFVDKWTGSQKRVVLSGLLFLTIVFSSKGQDFFSQNVYSFYKNGMESGNLYTALNSMAKEAIGVSNTGNIAVNAPVHGIFYPPVSGVLKVGFQGKNYAGKISNGIEIESSLGTPVLCPKEGVVQEISENESSGRMIRINFSDGWEGILGNLGGINVKKGDPVSMGLKIGTVGISSGRQKPWLYLELRQNGKAVNPLNYLIQK